MASYSQILSSLREAFRSGITRSIDWRRRQLQQMVSLLDENRIRLEGALHADLHKSKQESYLFEIDYTINDAINSINSLQQWMKPEKVSKGMLNVMDTCYIQPQPYGVALVMGAWNYPIQLALLPVIGAIAAGNCVVLKPSEISENTANLLAELMPTYMDESCIKVVSGGIPETTELLKEHFDYIFYTGNGTVGRIVMAAAAKNLTPVTLELGGKSPVYIDKSSNMEVAARRVLWGKCCNAGQTCIAPDFILCSPDIQDTLIEEMKKALLEFFGENPKKSPDFGRIVNDRHFQRVSKLLEGASIAIGGNTDASERYISPTVLRDVKINDPVMQEEIFGPLLPIVSIADADDALKLLSSRDKPLALYVFAKDQKVIDQFVTGSSSGGLVINDTIMHAGLMTLPFGGIGESGMGQYHGKFTFDTFSHSRGCLVKDQKMESANGIRYPPYTEKKMGWALWLTKRKEKRSGMLGLLPFMILGTLLALLVKTFSIKM